MNDIYCDLSLQLHGFMYIIYIHFQYGKLVITIDRSTQMVSHGIMQELKQYLIRYFTDAYFNCMECDLYIGSKYVISKHYCVISFKGCFQRYCEKKKCFMFMNHFQTDKLNLQHSTFAKCSTMVLNFQFMALITS